MPKRKPKYIPQYAKPTAKKNRLWAVLLAVFAALASVTAAVIVFFWQGEDMPEQLAVTVAFNPHSISCDMLTALISGIDIPVAVSHIPGAAGAAGANAVYTAPRGENLLATSLSAFILAEPMGFGLSGQDDWVGWLTAFAPAVVAVSHDSPHQHIYSVIITSNLRIVSSGHGTVSFVAAQAFADIMGRGNFEHITAQGSNVAIDALNAGEADVAILLLPDASNLRILASFDENQTSFSSLSGLDLDLDALLPFGEFYGIFAPADIGQSRLNSIYSIIQNASQTASFSTFANTRSLIPLNPNTQNDANTIDRRSQLIRLTLINEGFLPQN